MDNFLSEFFRIYNINFFYLTSLTTFCRAFSFKGTLPHVARCWQSQSRGNAPFQIAEFISKRQISVKKGFIFTPHNTVAMGGLCVCMCWPPKQAPTLPRVYKQIICLARLTIFYAVHTEKHQFFIYFFFRYLTTN